MDSRGKAIKIEPETPDSSDQESLQEIASAPPPSHPPKGKYRRHSRQQVQKLEEFYQKCSHHPNGEQQQQLGMSIGLELKQVKSWFQNRRTQAKVEMDRGAGMFLRQENERLRAENMILRQAMAYCDCCRRLVYRPAPVDEERELLYENAKLLADIERLRGLNRMFLYCSNWNHTAGSNRAVSSIGSSSRHATMPKQNPYEVLLTESVNEVALMACVGEPLWTKTQGGDIEMLNLDEYYRKFFPCGAKNVPGIVHEASRATGLVFVDASFLVGKLMDLDRWTEIFPSIVAAVSIEKMITNGVQGTRNQAVPLLKAELLPILSPLGPTRPVKFLRFCKQLDNNTWIVLDVSPDLRSDHPNSQSGFTRFPSGFVIQGVNKEHSRVTVVDHWEWVGNKIPHQFQTYLSSELGFDAKKWLNALQHYVYSLSIPLPALHRPFYGELSPGGKVSLLHLSGRMVNTFCTGLFGLTNQRWDKFPDADAGDKIKIFTRKNQFGESSCILISAVTSVWMPVEKNVMFGLLCDVRLDTWEHSRHVGEMHELVRITRGTEPGNRLSVFGRGTCKSDEESKMLVLQETYNYDWGSVIVHAPLDSSSATIVMNGEDSSGINLLPSGFTILPGCCAAPPEAVAGSSQKPREDQGCLLTVGFQILAKGSLTQNVMEETVKAIKQMICGTIQKVENALPVNLDHR